jgi:hypothetical protein
MSQVEEFFNDLDRSWPLGAGAPVTLRLLGSTALILQTSFQRGTKDGDILETDQITVEIESALLAIAGKDTAIHRRHRMYLEFLSAAFPFLPFDPLWHAVVPSAPDYQHFRLEVLDVVDVVIAKLARFHKTDRDDIAAMAERDLIEPRRFAERFQSAVRRAQRRDGVHVLSAGRRGGHWSPALPRRPGSELIPPLIPRSRRCAGIVSVTQ